MVQNLVLNRFPRLIFYPLKQRTQRCFSAFFTQGTAQ